MGLFFFYYLAGVIILTALLVVALRNPIYSVLSLLIMFFHVAGLYVTLLPWPDTTRVACSRLPCGPMSHTTVLSLLPMVGAATVWIPAAIYLYLEAGMRHTGIGHAVFLTM